MWSVVSRHILFLLHSFRLISPKLASNTSGYFIVVASLSNIIFALPTLPNTHPSPPHNRCPYNDPSSKLHGPGYQSSRALSSSSTFVGWRSLSSIPLVFFSLMLLHPPCSPASFTLADRNDQVINCCLLTNGEWKFTHLIFILYFHE